VAKSSPAAADCRVNCWRCGVKGHIQRSCVSKSPLLGDPARSGKTRGVQL
jgi:hypothetical protein